MFITHNPTVKAAAGAAGASVKIPTKTKWEDIMAPWTTG